jgi:hypothetical protein
MILSVSANAECASTDQVSSEGMAYSFLISNVNAWLLEEIDNWLRMFFWVGSE